MKSKKVKVGAVLLIAGVLCAGTTTALAKNKYGKLDDCSVAAETYAYRDNFTGMSRTLSSSHEALTSVDAYCIYENTRTGEGESIYKSDMGSYGAEVTFSMPTEYNFAVEIGADHLVVYKGQIWECGTVESFE